MGNSRKKDEGGIKSIAWEEQLEYKWCMRMQEEEEPVEAYIQDIINLCTKLDLAMNKNTKINHVLSELNASILQKVMMMKNDSQRHS